MSLLNILTYPHPFLKTQAKPVEKFDESNLRELTENMTETMYENQGVGLAAVQIGENKRVIVVDVTYVPENIESRNPIVLINPVILEKKGEKVTEEGCLSVPEFRAAVIRFAEISVEYQTLQGEKTRIQADGLFAVCLQHEIDHLNGILFIDHLPPLKRSMVRKKLKKMSQNA